MTSPYTKDGIVFPRCTNIIGDCTDKSGALVGWATGCCIDRIEELCDWTEWDDDVSDGYYTVRDTDLKDIRFAYKTVSDTALDVGSEVHSAIEWYLKNERIPTFKTQEAITAFKAFHEWAKEHDLKPLEVEKTVYASRWAGTLDFYGYFDDKLYVIDWKTSKPRNKKTGKGIYPESRYQVAAYRIAIEDEIQDEDLYPQGCGVLRLDKETGMPDWTDTSKTFDSDLRVFNRMVDLYFERHPRIAKRFEHITPF